MLKIILSWIQQHIVTSVVIGIVVIGSFIVTPIVIMNQDKAPTTQDKILEQKLILKDSLVFEINSEISLLSLVSEDNKVKILSEDKLIDTSTLGEKEISIKYLSEEQEKEEIFKVSIVDTTAPTIQFQKELSTTVGDKIDLLKDVKAIDNSKEDIKVTIEGEYSFNKEGTYNLKYVAIDSSIIRLKKNLL